MYKIESIREIQLLELIIAKEIKRICEKNNIRYFLVGGTLLGSIRHKGFIPWDDDMDIGMLYPDWVEFIICAKSQLSDKFYLDVWDEDNAFGYPFAKVRLNNTVMKEKTVEGLNINMGIWVDVFPYYPTDEIKVRKSIRYLQFIAKAYLLKTGYKINSITSKKINQTLNSLISFSVKILPKRILKKYYKKLIRDLHSNNPELYIELDGRFKGQFLFDKSIFDNYIMWQFEDTTFPIPDNYDKYLKKAYGNYMELPPVEQRSIGHSLSEVYLEKNIGYYFKNK